MAKINTKKEPVFTGTYRANLKGFGFVAIEGLEDELHIAERYVHDALDGDTVEVRIIGNNRRAGRPEGEITRIVARGRELFVGTYEKSRSFGFVIVDDLKVQCDIFVKDENSLSAVTGSKVVVRVTDFGNNRKKPEGEIVEVLGHMDDPGVDVLSIAVACGITPRFPEEVTAEADAKPQKVLAKDKRGRTDFRNLLTVTIDGADTKDIDDAVSIEKIRGGYRLYVHIADVSNYVTEGSALDEEAKKRGTSVYLVDRVIPMLPHALSNGICSLNEGVERLALSCVMEFDKKGNLKKHDICESLIKSNHKMTYDEVQEILDHPRGGTARKYSDVASMLKMSLELSDILRAKRKARGSIDFDFPECKITLTKKGHVKSVELYERKRSHLIIEDLMLAANETVAKEFCLLESPFVYRIHEKPEEAKMETLNGMLRGLGVKVKNISDVKPGQLAAIIEKTAGTPDADYISTVILRSMQKAAYSPECAGHFGLAAEYYCHFTSPIRRYPDLQIHRIIKEHLRGKMTKKRLSHYESILPLVCEHSSVMERRADEAERETEKYKKVEFMEDKLGEIFEGKISGVTGWGVYVVLPNTIEGMIPTSSIRGDHFIYDEKHLMLIGERTGKIFRIGDEIKVQLAATDKNLKTIDFVIYDKNNMPSKEKKNSDKAVKKGKKNGGKKRGDKARRKQ